MNVSIDWPRGRDHDSGGLYVGDDPNCDEDNPDVLFDNSNCVETESVLSPYDLAASRAKPWLDVDSHVARGVVWDIYDSVKKTGLPNMLGADTCPLSTKERCLVLYCHGTP